MEEQLLSHIFISSISCGPQTEGLAAGGGRLLFPSRNRSSASASASFRPHHLLPSWRILLKRSNHVITGPTPTFSMPSPGASPKFERWDTNGGTSVPRAGFRSKEEGVGEGWNEEEEWGGVGRKTGKRRWWSGDEPPSLEEEEEEEAGIWEEALESFWFLKVIKSYSWIVIPISISWLFETGPKAFLMSLALPLGQGALTFAFNKLWEAATGQKKTKSRKRKRKRPYAYASSASDTKRGMDVQEPRNKEAAKGKKSSWFGAANGDNAAQKVERDVSDFGGWDELDSTEVKQPPRRTDDRSSKAPPADSKLSTEERRTDVSLLLRLLIAVFPFLGYWSKIL